MDGTMMIILMIAAGTAVSVLKRKRSELKDETEAEGRRPEMVPPKANDSTEPAETHWPTSVPAHAVKRVAASQRMVIVVHGARRGQWVRCTECEVAGTLATEVVQVLPDGTDVSEPEYLTGYSVSRTVSEFVG
jgi:hypothetical protein